MVYWKKIDHLEKIMSKYILILFDTHDLNENFTEEIKLDYYGIISFKKNNDILIINFESCILKNRFILNKSKKDICCVCYDECESTLKCGHYLCNICFESWLLNNNSCPV